jgi:hypothetical protein
MSTSWTTPRDWTTDELVTEAMLDTHVRDNLEFLGSPPLAELRHSGTQSISTSTNTALQFDSEVYDSHGGHSDVTNNSRYTAVVAGWYEVISCAGIAANSTGSRRLFLQKNGTTTFAFKNQQNLTTTECHQCISGLVELAVGDYVEAIVWQDSGSSRNTALTGSNPVMFVRLVSV